ncbi:pentapeptide repeat-containing protein [Halorubellus litoreus]|uniref:Pentapeptide repeat-containing protein n=1 Tax=Halorubellus litoreus TaxID=755308 RepID=A0ABD5VJI4_9EURY
MVGEDSLRNCSLREGNFENAELESWDLHSAHLSRANLRDVSLWGTDLSEANLTEADLTDSFLSGAQFDDAILRRSTLTSANLRGTQLPNADLTKANLTNAECSDAQLTHANLTKATLTDASLQNTNLSNSNLERATMIRTDLFDAILPNAKMEGTLFADARVNESTFQNLASEENQKKDRKLRTIFRRLILGPEGRGAYRCAYDPKALKNIAESDNSDYNNPEVRAGGVYLELERLADRNALQKWEGRFFILRQDMQLYKLNRESRYSAALYHSMEKSIFGYGERFSRVIGWSITIILLFALTYLQGGWIRPVKPGGALGPAISSSRLSEGLGVIWESIYYSTLTFTALGFGDFRPTTSIGQFFTIAETALGAVMIALLVFVMGRRASR